MPETSNIRSRAIASPRLGWLMVALLAVTVGCFGGSSRQDAVQIVALRPLMALFLLLGVYLVTRDSLRGALGPVLVLSGLVLLMTLQLVPLPPIVWQALPGRGEVAQMDNLLAVSGPWRPISLVPARTINALASLVVPAAALVCLLALRTPRNVILYMIAGLGLANAMVALTQMLSGGGGALYPYAITNTGSAVGIFANQNHSGVFAALTLLVTAYLLGDSLLVKRSRVHKTMLTIVFLLLLMVALTGGSRAGLVATVLAIGASGAILWVSATGDPRQAKALPQIFGMPLRPASVLAAATLLVAAVLAMFVAMERVPALQDLTDQGPFDDLRWRLIPTLATMLRSFWLFGSGFGSFEEVYHLFEPVSLMEPAYVNQAHNDWVQLVIEGGLAAIGLLAAGICWYIQALHKIGWNGRREIASQMFWLTAAIVISLASLVDYPVRTPIFQVSLSALAVALCRERSG